jgi:hypothetical protein
LKFGQVVVVVQDIPVATAARSQLVAQVATMPLEQLPFNPVGPIQFVLVVHGLVTGHIPAMQAWAVDHMLTDVISAIFALQAVAVVGCVMEMHGGRDTTTADVLTVIFADFLVLI